MTMESSKPQLLPLSSRDASGLSQDMPGFVRELGVFERMMYYMGKYNAAYLSNALHIVSKVPLTEGLIHAALQRLMKIIPTLRYVIRETAVDGRPLDGPVFMELASPHIDMKTLDSSEWIDILSKEWMTGFDTYHGPCWRVKFLPNVELPQTDDEFKYGGTVVFSFLHSIIDGMGYQRLFGHFLDCLEAVASGNKEEPTSFQPAPPLDHFLDCHHGLLDKILTRFFTFILKRRQGRSFFAWLSAVGKTNHYLNTTKLPIEEDPSTPVRSLLVPLVISESETRSLVRAAKARGTTVNGVLVAASIMAYAKLIQGEERPLHMKLPTITPISMRRLSKELTLNSYGMYVQLMEIDDMEVHLNSVCDEYEEFWRIAKASTEEVNKQLKKKSYLFFYRLMTYILPAFELGFLRLQDLTAYQYGRNVHETYLTNMMKCDFLTRQRDATFRLVGRFGGIGSAVVGEIIGNNLNTFNDQIYWSLIYDEHIIRRERVEEYGKMIKDMLNYISGDTPV